MTSLPAVAALWSVVTILVTAPTCGAQQNPVGRVTVRTPLGSVSGRVTQVQDIDVNQFLGIPYAEPPTNERRFSKPVAVRPWSSTLDATDLGFSCPQPGLDRETSEDCLHLNIYVRANESSNTGLKAVMVWIHGGGFQVGSGRDVDGSLMAARGDVVVVTLNYRLGMLGWLSTMDAASPGNYGLWDQVMALTFLRDNVRAFGGDPAQMTLFGQSGGGYSVGLLSVSPVNSGLFQRVIMQSGSALNRRTIALDPVGFARRLAANLTCLRSPGNTFDSQFFVSCARQRTVAEILQATGAASARSSVAWELDVAPVVDGELVPADVRTLLGPAYRASVPFWALDVMAGTTSAEGSLVLSPLQPFQAALGFQLQQGIPTRVLCANVTTALARDYFRGSRAVSEALCRFYSSQGGGGDADQGRRVVDMYGDMMFLSAAVETLQRHFNGTGSRRRHFQYLFSHVPLAARQPFSWFQGAAHSAEVAFVFGTNIADAQEIRLSRAVMDGWTNFAKFGSPNNPQTPSDFQWPEYDNTNRAYTDLDLTVTSQRDVFSPRMQFWMQRVPALMATNGTTRGVTTGRPVGRNTPPGSRGGFSTPPGSRGGVARPPGSRGVSPSGSRGVSPPGSPGVSPPGSRGQTRPFISTTTRAWTRRSRPKYTGTYNGAESLAKRWDLFHLLVVIMLSPLAVRCGLML